MLLFGEYKKPVSVEPLILTYKQAQIGMCVLAFQKNDIRNFQLKRG